MRGNGGKLGGYTLLELLAAITITSIILPIIAIVFYQVMTVPPDQSARLTLTNEVQNLANMLYQDASKAANFSNCSYPCYGMFNWSDYSTLQNHNVSYSYDTGKNRIVRTDIVTALPTPPATATPTPSPSPSPSPTPSPGPTPSPYPSMASNTTTYNYVSTTGKSAAEASCAASSFPINPTATCGGNAWSTANTTSMANISSSNDVRWETPIVYQVENALNIQRYFVNVSENISNISMLNVSWEGYGCSGTNQVTNTSIYNYISSSWLTLSSQTDKSSDTWFNGSISSGISNYFSGQQLAVLAAAEEPPAPCPRMYVWDRETYQFIDSAASGRLLKRLSGTNYPATDIVRPKNGYYDLMIFEPSYETSYIDKLGLWVVDHPEGTEIISEADGTIHTVSEPKTLTAVDSYGDNVTSLLSKMDGAEWTPDITSKNFSDDSQLQDWIELTLPDIPQVDISNSSANDGTAKLMVVAHYNSLSLLQLWSYYVYILGSPNLNALVERVETDTGFSPYFDYGLWGCIDFQVQVWNGSEWVHYTDIKITDGPPHIALLKLSDINGDKIRLSVPAGAFSIDYVAVDYTADEPVTVTKLQPAEAFLFTKSPSNTLWTLDVLQNISSEDGSYATMHLGDWLNYKFKEVSGPADGMTRSFVIPCTGYYITDGPEVSENKSENWPLIEQLTFEPLAYQKWVYPRYVDWLNNGSAYDCNKYDWSYIMAAPFPATEKLVWDTHSLSTDYVEVKLTWRPLYTLTTTNSSGGTITKPGISTYTYLSGTAVNLSAIPNSCYRFVNWTGNKSTIPDPTSANATITMNDNYSIMANFAMLTYTLSLTAYGPGGLPYSSPSGPTFNCGTNVSIFANPSTGYNFSIWSPSDGVGNISAANTTVLVNQNRSLTAFYNFIPTPTPPTSTTYKTYLTSHITGANFSLSESKTNDYIVANITAGINTSLNKYIEKQLTIYITPRAGAVPTTGRGGIWGEDAVTGLNSLDLSGNFNIFNGDLYVDGTVTVTGNNNSVTGTLYNDSLVIAGGSITYAKGVSPCPTVAMPNIGVPQDYFVAHNLSLGGQVLDDVNHEYIFTGNVSLTSITNVWQNNDPGTHVLKDGYYYSPGTITLSDRHTRGSVTFIANQIIIENDTAASSNCYPDYWHCLDNYIGIQFFDDQGLLLWATGNGSNSICIRWKTGCLGDWNACAKLLGMIFAPNGGIVLSGTDSGVTSFDLPFITKGGIMGKYLTISGNRWFIYRW